MTIEKEIATMTINTRLMCGILGSVVEYLEDEAAANFDKGESPLFVEGYQRAITDLVNVTEKLKENDL